MVKRIVYRRTCHAINTPGEAHYLTFSCYKRRDFLARDRTRQYLIEAIEKARVTHAFDLWAYIIMSNHAHVFIFPRQEKYDMGAIETSIKVSVSRRALNYLREHNPEGLRHLATGQVHTPYRFWTSGNGYDKNITSLPATNAIVEYILNNPVRAGICANPEDWPWSSAREWVEEGSGPLRIDRESYPY